MSVVLRIALWWIVANVVLVAILAITTLVADWRERRSIDREIDRDLAALFGAGIDVPLPRRRRAHRSGR